MLYKDRETSFVSANHVVDGGKSALVLLANPPNTWDEGVGLRALANCSWARMYYVSVKNMTSAD